MVKVICPKCRAELRVSARQIGKQGKCRRCHALIVPEFPDGYEESKLADSSLYLDPVGVECTWCGEDQVVPYESIDAKRTCKYCQREFSPGTPSGIPSDLVEKPTPEEVQFRKAEEERRKIKEAFDTGYLKGLESGRQEGKEKLQKERIATVVLTLMGMSGLAGVYVELGIWGVLGVAVLIGGFLMLVSQT